MRGESVMLVLLLYPPLAALCSTTTDPMDSEPSSLADGDVAVLGIVVQA